MAEKVDIVVMEVSMARVSLNLKRFMILKGISLLREIIMLLMRVAQSNTLILSIQLGRNKILAPHSKL